LLKTVLRKVGALTAKKTVAEAAWTDVMIDEEAKWTDEEATMIVVVRMTDEVTMNERVTMTAAPNAPTANHVKNPNAVALDLPQRERSERAAQTPRTWIHHARKKSGNAPRANPPNAPRASPPCVKVLPLLVRKARVLSDESDLIHLLILIECVKARRWITSDCRWIFYIWSESNKCGAILYPSPFFILLVTSSYVSPLLYISSFPTFQVRSSYAYAYIYR
jgi:hypothetical protein